MQIFLRKLLDLFQLTRKCNFSVHAGTAIPGTVTAASKVPLTQPTKEPGNNSMLMHVAQTEKRVKSCRNTWTKILLRHFSSSVCKFFCGSW